MKEIIIATKNAGKVKEFNELFKGYNVKSLLDFPEIEDVEETGTTFKENAVIKAEAISKMLNKTVIADDSGLAVDHLNGEPGVYSARYAGLEKSDAANNNKLLKNLEGVPLEKRTAQFICALAMAIPGEETKIVEGTCKGLIALNLSGDNGFGYDPLFYLPNMKKTMAELTREEKNEISHRANALKKLSALVENTL